MEVQRGQIKYYTDDIKFGKYNILFLNINSLRQNLEELEFILKEKPRIYFIVLTGIKIPAQQNALFNLNNYQSYFNNRGDGKGGVAVYVHQNMISSEVENSYVDNVHQVVVKIHSLNIHLGIIYTQSETNKEGTLQLYNELIGQYRNMILFSDIGVDLLHWNNQYTHQYFNDTLNQQFMILNSLTRTSATKMNPSQIHPYESMPTIVDHIASDLKAFNFTISLSDVIFSDHRQIVLGFDDHSRHQISFYTGPKVYQQREINTQKYSSLLARTDFDTVDNFNDFIEILFDIRNESWTLVFKENPSDSSHPWHNQELSELIQKRNDFFKLLKNEPKSQYLHTMTTELADQVAKLFASLRSQYNGQRINECAKNPAKMKQIISQIIENRNNEREKINAIRSENGRILTKPKQIANCFNRYFKDVGLKLYNDIPDNALEFFDTLDYSQNELFIHPVHEDEIAQKIAQMKLTTHRNEIITSKLLKENADLLVPILTDLVNECLETATFPGELKIARIVPMFKKSEKNRLTTSNYRPINVLQSLSKLIEMVIYDRILNYCIKHKIFHKHQFGFMKKTGAAGAAATLLDFIQANVDDSSFGACVFMDLKKAVDTIPHTNLLEKLYKIGIRGKFLALIEDCLRDRKQFVDIHGTFSAVLDCNPIGIPQGCVLGSLFFILYVNDIFNLPFIGKVLLYCDDITLVYVTNNARRVEEDINYDLNLLNNWLIYNKLTINMEKIKYMIISRNPRFFNVKLNLTVNDQDIERVRTQKYLGLLIQHNLKWNQQISKVARSIDGIGGTIKRLGSNIDIKARKHIYFTMVHKYLTNLLPIFGISLKNVDVNTLQRAQDKVIRRLFGRDSDGQTVTDALYKDNGIMKVKQLIQLDLALLHRKMQMDSHTFGRNVHANNRALDFTAHIENTIRYECEKTYNDLEPGLQDIDAYDLFKRSLKQFILSNNELEL